MFPASATEGEAQSEGVAETVGVRVDGGRVKDANEVAEGIVDELRGVMEMPRWSMADHVRHRRSWMPRWRITGARLQRQTLLLLLRLLRLR